MKEFCVTVFFPLSIKNNNYNFLLNLLFMSYKKCIKAINNRFLRGRQPTQRVCTASK
jgi:hypothetical protein